MVAHGDDFKEIGLSKKAVEGLKNMNKNKRGTQFDALFLKALIIGFCTIRKIKANGCVEDGIFELISDLFEWRAMANEERMNGLRQMFYTAVNEIKNNNFKP